MAEGHAVIRWARQLAGLVGEPLTHVAMPKRWGDRPEGLIGQHLLEPVTRGEHLLLPLSGGETLHGHGAQYGSWQVGPRPLELRNEARHVQLRLDTAAHEAEVVSKEDADHGVTARRRAPCWRYRPPRPRGRRRAPAAGPTRRA